MVVVGTIVESIIQHPLKGKPTELYSSLLWEIEAGSAFVERVFTSVGSQLDKNLPSKHPTVNFENTETKSHRRTLFVTSPVLLNCVLYCTCSVLLSCSPVTAIKYLSCLFFETVTTTTRTGCVRRPGPHTNMLHRQHFVVLAALLVPQKPRLEALQKIMTSRSHAVPARATQESLRLLATLEKDIPVMKALTNAHLKDRHWWQVRVEPCRCLVILCMYVVCIPIIQSLLEKSYAAATHRVLKMG